MPARSVLRSFHPLFSVLATDRNRTQRLLTQSYDAGCLDKKGVYAGGSELHIVPTRETLRIDGSGVDACWVIPPDGQSTGPGSS